MTEDSGTAYPSGLPEDQRDELARVNGPGLAALRGYLATGEAVAFLGAAACRRRQPLLAAKAEALHQRLVPPDLDPDPLATVERLVAEQKAAEQAGDTDNTEGDD